MSNFNLEYFNYYNIDHAKVLKEYGNQLKYIGTFCIKKEYTPRAFYFNPNPNLELQHKDYLTIKAIEGVSYISGVSKEELENWRYQIGLLCPNCNDIIHSVYRHDMRHCKCGTCFIDGGRDYIRSSFSGISIKIDLISGTYS